MYFGIVEINFIEFVCKSFLLLFHLCLVRQVNLRGSVDSRGWGPVTNLSPLRGFVFRLMEFIYKIFNLTIN